MKLFNINFIYLIFEKFYQIIKIIYFFIYIFFKSHKKNKI